MTAEEQLAQGGPLGQLVDKSYEQYVHTKDLLASNKTIGSKIVPWVDWTESQTKAMMDKSPIHVEDVVTAVDTRAENLKNAMGARKESLKSYSQESIKAIKEAPQNTLGYFQTKLQGLRTTEEDANTEEEPNVSTVLNTGKSAAAEQLNVLLDAGEGYMKQYLPISEDEKAFIVDGSKSEFRTVAFRTLKMSKVAALKTREAILARAGKISERTRETVHVDLIKYNDWLDQNVKSPVSQRLKLIDEKLALSDKMVQVDTSYVKPMKERVHKRVQDVDTKLVRPVKDRFVLVVTTISDKYQEKLVQPIDQIVQMFREELSMQQEIAKHKSGEDELTISAGLAAVVAAARLRLEKEYEVRISPALARFIGRKQEEEEEEEEEESMTDVIGEPEEEEVESSPGDEE